MAINGKFNQIERLREKKDRKLEQVELNENEMKKKKNWEQEQNPQGLR